MNELMAFIGTEVVLHGEKLAVEDLPDEFDLELTDYTAVKLYLPDRCAMELQLRILMLQLAGAGFACEKRYSDRHHKWIYSFRREEKR